MDKLTLVLMAGPPGSGKTTLALGLSEALRWPTIDKDTLKSPLLEAGVPEEVAGPASYDLMFNLGRDLLARQGMSVILDSPAGYPTVIERADELAREVGARLKPVLCLADREMRNARMAGRASSRSQWTTDVGLHDDGTESWGPLMPPHALEVRTHSPVECLLPEIIEYLQGD